MYNFCKNTCKSRFIRYFIQTLWKGKYANLFAFAEKNISISLCSFYDSGGHHFNHCSTRTPLNFIMQNQKGIMLLCLLQNTQLIGNTYDSGTEFELKCFIVYKHDPQTLTAMSVCAVEYPSCALALYITLKWIWL